LADEGANARLQALAQRYGLDDSQVEQLERLLSMLAEDPHAPTALRGPETAIDGHIADSLVALELEAVRGARVLADLGSGAGFPGLPLAIALRKGRVWLLESQLRKCAYLERAATRARVQNVHVVCSRVEDWSDEQPALDVALARALAPSQVVVEYAAPLLRHGGLLVDWRGRRDGAEERKAALAAAKLGMERVEIRPVVPFETARARHLHLYLKVSETPSGFPRRAGMALKRPLGA
jgi:16S rRNA (guanine527-N7)-methyltransferase